MIRFHHRLVAIACLILLLVASMASAEKVPWLKFDGRSPLTPGLPDTASRYDTLSFYSQDGDWELMKLSAEYPFARYYSLHAYVSGADTAFASLADRDIQPDTGHINPFQPGNDRDAQNRSFTVWLTKPGVQAPIDARNVIEIPDSMDRIVLMTRVYRPDRDADSLGNVSLPDVDVFHEDLSPGEPPDYGKGAVSSDSGNGSTARDRQAAWQRFRDLSGNDLIFHRMEGNGLFPNHHAGYILTHLPQNDSRTASVITFLPATHEDTYDGSPITGLSQVRYWSVCVGGLIFTETAGCIVDDEALYNQDGTITVVVGPAFMKNIVENAGLNFIAYRGAQYPVFWLRHILPLPDFNGSAKKVPPVKWNKDISPEEFQAKAAYNFMNGYAPTGSIVNLYELLRFLR